MGKLVIKSISKLKYIGSFLGLLILSIGNPISAGHHAENKDEQIIFLLDLEVIDGKPVSYTHLTLPTTPYV